MSRGWVGHAAGLEALKDEDNLLQLLGNMKKNDSAAAQPVAVSLY